MSIIVNEYQYSKEKLELILNSNLETLVSIDNWLIITKQKASTEVNIKPITKEIDLLIQELKQVCNEQWLAYDKTKERMFWKHIISAKEYWEFAEKVWLNRIELAKNIIIASRVINFWKSCTWPMAVYQNYADIYNKSKSLQEKKPKVIDYWLM